jgi:MFS family permease
VFAVYAVAVAVSLFLVGHASDWYGRRRVLMPALALEILAGAVFIAWPSLPGLLLARLLSGLGIGAVTATATAWLSELRSIDNRRAQTVATAANVGGLGVGGLIAGALAQWAGHPLLVPSPRSPECCCWRGLPCSPRPRPAPRGRRGHATGHSTWRCRQGHAGASSPPRSPARPSRAGVV